MFGNIAYSRYSKSTIIFNEDKSTTRVHWSVGVAVTVWHSDKLNKPEIKPPVMHVMYDAQSELVKG